MTDFAASLPYGLTASSTELWSVVLLIGSAMPT
jgi:hypothetical protein